MEGTRLNFQILGTKVQTKNEMYRLLTVEANI